MFRIRNTPLIVSAFVAVACSHGIKRVDYPVTASPVALVQELESDIQSGYKSQLDVLDRADFEMAQKRLDTARDQIKSQKSQEKVLATLGESRAYLNRAQEIANGRRSNVEGILQAREAALTAGAREYPNQREKLGQIDNDLRELAGDKTVSPKEFSRLQSEYLDLELASIQAAQLNTARSKIIGAREKSAKSYTPKTLNRAETDLRNAENVIASHRHEPSAFQEAVNRANDSADLLVDMSQKVRSGKAVLPEDVALKLVLQERRLSSLKNRLESSQANVETSREQATEQGRELAQAKARQELDRMIAESRKEFNQDEAEVFRDGDKVLIRLKAMAFPSGRAELPAASIALLGKVKNVASQLDPAQIVIEGHTDSTGGSAVNMPLSQKRAEAVARYLETNGISADKIQAIGLGYKKPIASNKSREGRAQNRRVDVIITPTAPESATTSM